MTYPELSVGNVYRVLGIEANDLRIVDDTGEPVLYAARAFEFVDATYPDSWTSVRGEEGELYAYPGALQDPPCFFDRFFDKDERVRAKFHAHIQKLCFEEAAARAYPPNYFVRLCKKSVNNHAPVEEWVELDELRVEIRKLEVFADGHIDFANVRGSSGKTCLRDAPLPPFSEIGRIDEVEVVQISRDEFELLWTKALETDDT